MRLSLLLISVSRLCLGAHFDYVIVGGGTSGLLIANRLSRDPHVTVAVIDPGSNERENPIIMDSAPWEPLLTSPVTNWKYKTQPQESANGRVLDLHSGKGLGGSSLINGMAYVRGDKAQYDSWEQLGNEGWNWNALLPYFKKAEKMFQPASTWQVERMASIDTMNHGFSGEMHVGFLLAEQNRTFFKSVQQTWAKLGQEMNQDINSGMTEGAAVSPQTIDPGLNRRWDAATAFLWPVINRPNLHLLNGTATRVVWKEGISENDSVASGVEYVTPEKARQTVQATREVVLSAGVYRTPLILERSGVGNPLLLSKLSIPTVVDLPGVGENLVDQSALPFIFKTQDGLHGGSPYVSFTTAAGIFGANVSRIAAEVRANISPWAQQLAATNPLGPPAATLEHIFRLQHNLIFTENVTVSEIFTTTYAGNVVSLAANVLPFSRGSIHLGTSRDKNDNDYSNDIETAIINPRFLTIPFDLTMQVASGRLASKLSLTPPLSLLAKGTLLPTSASTVESPPPTFDATEKEWRHWTTASISSNLHSMGTTAMMARDLGGVVDARLRVYGTKGLRIMDASVLPGQVSGHPMATLYAVAERMAEMMVEDAIKERNEDERGRHEEL